MPSEKNRTLVFLKFILCITLSFYVLSIASLILHKSHEYIEAKTGNSVPWIVKVIEFEEKIIKSLHENSDGWGN